MSFCLVTNPQATQIDIHRKDIVFVKIVQAEIQSKSVMILSRQGELQLYDFDTGVKMYESRLQYQEEALKGVLNVQEAFEILYFITYPYIYSSPLPDLIAQLKKCQAINMNRLQIRSKKENQCVDYSKLMNKKLKLYGQNGKAYLKLCGRTKSSLIYYYSQLKFPQKLAQLIFSYQQTINNELTISLNSLDPDVLLFQSYSSKSKPIKLTILQFIPYLQQEKGADHLRRQVDVLHFSQQLTVIEVFKISVNALCIFGNNSFEAEGLSLMIVYNFKEGFTLNYVNFKNALIDRVIAFFPCGTMCSSTNLAIKFDGFSSDDKYSHYYQLWPKSYRNEEDCLLKGKVLTSDEDYIICSTNRYLLIHPKIHKATIYSKFLTHIKAEYSLTPMILQLLQ